ncbi:checkpoint protein HUS1 [Agrilus planipennis]|uniref:Checkpoint protein n=1 Tax=Agrilus planipennis TaxID=224129 RepID=A0A7F5RH57_AGRPL|nr:checkpoint protein HUS1 [Agrilus planipennis]
MKFRGVMTDAIAMKDFMNVAVAVSKLAKECVMRITKRKVYFIISEEDAGPRRPLVWCELPVNFYFSEYILEGVNEDYNEIYLSFATGMLSRSLSTLKQNPKSLKVKLTNKQTPCLTLEIELISGEGIQNRQCVHDIPVETISRKHWKDYEEPHFNDFHVTLQMPHLKPIKNIVERMKNISNALTVSATKDGRLTLAIQETTVNMSAHFPDLSVESFAGNIHGFTKTVTDEDNLEIVSATIDIKKFLMFITGMHINNNCTTICSIVQEKMVKLFLEQPGSLSLQCFLTQLII